MTDDDRRAEVEAVARVLKALPEPTMAAAEPYTVARAMIAALDRVRDARHDDEPQGVERELLRTIDQQTLRISEQEDRIGNLLGELKAARFPQGEDHEELIRNLLVAWLNRWEPGENQDLIDLAEKVLK